MVVETLREQWARIMQLDREIGEIESRIKLWHRSGRANQRVAEIPGVGVLTATAIASAMGDPAAFRSGREFAAWLGLLPRHKSTGGRVRLLGASIGSRKQAHPGHITESMRSGFPAIQTETTGQVFR